MARTDKFKPIRNKAAEVPEKYIKIVDKNVMSGRLSYTAQRGFLYSEEHRTSRKLEDQRHLIIWNEQLDQDRKD